MSQIKKHNLVAQQGTFTSYTTGFILSIIFTMIVYWIVTAHVHSGRIKFSNNYLTAIIAFLAVTQLITQLIFFLHLNKESKPRWNLLVLLFAGLIVLIVVAGSIWIMNNLNYNAMTPTQTNKYLIQQEGIKR